MVRTVTLPQLVQLRLPDDLGQSIDDYRRAHPDLPSRSEAIRQLIILGLQAKKPE
jgi:metal-responsive CopG/Arc/MetJ family transcriptional regulator